MARHKVCGTVDLPEPGEAKRFPVDGRIIEGRWELSVPDRTTWELDFQITYRKTI